MRASGFGTAPLLRRLRDDGQELDFEVERRVRRDDAAAGATLAVGHGGGAHDPGLAARTHQLHGFGPALDDAIELELGRLAALVGAVEFAAVEEAAAVVDPH